MASDEWTVKVSFRGERSLLTNDLILCEHHILYLPPVRTLRGEGNSFPNLLKLATVA